MFHSIGVFARAIGVCALFLFPALFLSGSASTPRTPTAAFEATAYCGCSKCCGWERGSWKALKLDLWNRYVESGPNAGRKYSGKTASGVKPATFDPGLLSLDTLKRPWKAPVRALQPQVWLGREGTIAADTDYYPFGTRMYVPGYGWGVVQDRGGAIKGPHRIDLYMKTHQEALEWGRQKVQVTVVLPGEDRGDR